MDFISITIDKRPLEQLDAFVEARSLTKSAAGIRRVINEYFMRRQLVGTHRIGKTRYTDVIEKLCYESINVGGSVRASPIYRLIDLWYSTALPQKTPKHIVG